MEITGILVKKTNEREGVSQLNGLAWKKAEFLLEVPGQRTRNINFRVSDGQTGRIAHFESLVGKTVTVSFDIDAHEYEGRWFNELNAWGVMEYVDSTKRHANMAAAQAGQNSATTTEQTDQPEDGKDKDDLPF